ncbi:hypothetical protein [Catelliglobosispora koreensis]|uniref:hypothetical protein n=1 Tax=Catelliglobosispora koreensis TaxID=129052 RepID=UPI00036CE66A|nr:hypothetical protein [Catelliglobosispora koreensis]
MSGIDYWQMEKHADTRPRRVFPPDGPAYWLGSGLMLAAVAAGFPTFLDPGILTGPAVMNGSARGTALVVLTVAVPILALCMYLTRRGNVRALIGWLGVTAYLLYNALMFVFATPFNQLFLLYIAMLSLAIFSLIAILAQLDHRQLRKRILPGMPVRGIAIYVWVIVALNLIAWLATIVPAMFAQTPAAFLEETGLTTNPVYVQDLSFWLLLMAVAGVWLWRRKVWGYLIAGSVLAMWVLESVSIAADQWFGHMADPASPIASVNMAWAFTYLAIVGIVPLFYFLRNVEAQ